jgi:hypothetical protein
VSPIALAPDGPGEHDAAVPIVINLLGLVACLISAIVGVGIADRIGHHDRHLEVTLVGLVLVVLDIAYRRVRGLKIIGWRGPAIFWLPAWIWGVLAFCAGASLWLEQR